MKLRLLGGGPVEDIAAIVIEADTRDYLEEELRGKAQAAQRRLLGDPSPANRIAYGEALRRWAIRAGDREAERFGYELTTGAIPASAIEPTEADYRLLGVEPRP